ncbi:MAG: acyltransferase, partial [Pseudomonadota bacterium]
AAVTGGGSALGRYQDVIVGRRSFTGLLYFEFCTWLSGVPGALGLLLRQVFWPRLLGSCGKKVYFGRNVTLMHPSRIRIGDRTVIGDGCVLDARNPTLETVLELGSEVMLSHGVVLSCKNGSIKMGDRCGLGPYSVVQSAHGNPVEIGNDVIGGSYCFVTGSGAYHTDRLDIPISQQGTLHTGGTTVEDGVWLGARAATLGGVSIGRDSIVGSGAVVSRSLPERSVSVGMPAKPIRTRVEETPTADAHAEETVATEQ